VAPSRQRQAAARAGKNEAGRAGPQRQLGWRARLGCARGLQRTRSRNEGATADLAILGSTKHRPGLGKGKGS
jgi:hypothetical protein